MPTRTTSFVFSSPDDTAHSAVKLGELLKTGDTILLSGIVGSGKTHFARHLIQSQLCIPEDVPSPTFTLVQTYETRAGQVWHADLYRITSVHEIEELGLTDAFGEAICLVEWPDRLGPLQPDDALMLSFESGAEPDVRRLTASWSDSRWTELMSAWTAA